MMSDLSGMIENAMGDPRFAQIFQSLKEKADAGELDVSKLLGTASEKEEKHPLDGNNKVSMENHKKLLSALRPYLADPKKTAVDEILKISEFSGVIEALSKKRDGR